MQIFLSIFILFFILYSLLFNTFCFPLKYFDTLHSEVGWTESIWCTYYYYYYYLCNMALLLQYLFCKCICVCEYCILIDFCSSVGDTIKGNSITYITWSKGLFVLDNAWRMIWRNKVIEICGVIVYLHYWWKLLEHLLIQ